MRFAIRIIINIEKCIAIKYTIFMNDIVFELNTRLKNNQERQKAIEKSIEFLPKGHMIIIMNLQQEIQLQKEMKKS